MKSTINVSTLFIPYTEMSLVVLWCLTPLQQPFSYIVAVSFIGA
jgi:hypothetical protein